MMLWNFSTADNSWPVCLSSVAPRIAVENFLSFCVVCQNIRFHLGFFSLTDPGIPPLSVAEIWDVKHVSSDGFVKVVVAFANFGKSKYHFKWVPSGKIKLRFEMGESWSKRGRRNYLTEFVPNEGIIFWEKIRKFPFHSHKIFYVKLTYFVFDDTYIFLWCEKFQFKIIQLVVAIDTSISLSNGKFYFSSTR